MSNVSCTQNSNNYNLSLKNIFFQQRRDGEPLNRRKTGGTWCASDQNVDQKFGSIRPHEGDTLRAQVSHLPRNRGCRR